MPEIKAVQQTRRLLANARERTRVHTISAAFEALRKQVKDEIHHENKQLGIQDTMSHFTWGGLLVCGHTLVGHTETHLICT